NASSCISKACLPFAASTPKTPPDHIESSERFGCLSQNPAMSGQKTARHEWGTRSREYPKRISSDILRVIRSQSSLALSPSTRHPCRNPQARSPDEQLSSRLPISWQTCL